MTMRIRINADGRVLEGTALQITEAMHGLAFTQAHRPLGDYIDWAVEQAGWMSDTELVVEGDTVEAKAASFVKAMLETGLAERA